MDKLHPEIMTNLNNFIECNKIPNILFYGPSGSGKKTIVKEFLNNVYMCLPLHKRHNYMMFIDCGQGRGIKFIREDLMFFARKSVLENVFKSVVLLNSDKLTHDAQSALRCCIEKFSNTTRFFMVVENKERLLNPIQSRFCEIYVPLPIIKNKSVNLNEFNNKKTYNLQKFKTQNYTNFRKMMDKLDKNTPLVPFVNKLYEKAFNSYDIEKYIISSDLDEVYKYNVLFEFRNIKKEIRNENLLMLFLVEKIIIRNNTNIDNIYVN